VAEGAEESVLLQRRHNGESLSHSLLDLKKRKERRRRRKKKNNGGGKEIQKKNEDNDRWEKRVGGVREYLYIEPIIT
jgi:hypothetical protein